MHNRAPRLASPLRLAAAAIAALSFAASADAQPQPQPPPKDPPPAGQPTSAGAPTIEVSDPMLTPVAPPPHVLAGWDEALTFISSRDADLKTALLEIERAKGQRRQTLAGTLPQLNASGSVTIQILRQDVTTTNPLDGSSITRTLPASPTANASITLTQPILAPRVWFGLGTADKVIDLAEINVEDARRLILANVANAIVAVVNAEQVAEVNRVSLRAALTRLALQQRKTDLGGGANLDLVRFRQDVNAARAILVAGDEQLMASREQLGLALGSSESYGVPRDIKLDDIAASAGSTCKPGKLEERADIRALYARKDIAERGVTDVDLQYVPTASVSSTLTGSSEQIIGDSHLSWNVMGVISIPIWDGGSRYGAHRIAKVEVDQAQERIDATVRQGTIEISKSVRAVGVATQARDLALESRDLAQENKRLADLAYDGGVGTSFDIIDASSRLREAELNLATRELEVTRAKITALLSASTCSY